jgi:hypothetical protein
VTQNAELLAVCVTDSAFASRARPFVSIAPCFGIDPMSGHCGFGFRSRLWVSHRQAGFYDVSRISRAVPDERRKLNSSPLQLADQPFGGFCVKKFVGDSQRANHLQVRAVLLAPTVEHDVVKLVAGGGERMVQAPMCRATRFPRVMVKLSRFAHLEGSRCLRSGICATAQRPQGRGLGRCRSFLRHSKPAQALVGT